MKMIDLNKDLKNQILSKTRCGKLLGPKLKNSLYDYLRSIIPEANMADDFSIKYRKHVMAGLKTVLKERNIENLDKLLREFEVSPIIQTGEHSGLLYNYENFMINWLFYIASKEKKRETMLSWQCSKVNSVIDKSNLYGPAYLRIHSDVFRIFDNINYPLSRTKLFHSSIAALNDVIFAFETEVHHKSGKVPSKLNDFRGMYFQSAPEAFIYANSRIWSDLTLPKKPDLIQIDDSFATDVILQNLQDSSSLIHKILFDDAIRSEYLNAKEQVINSNQNLTMRNTSDFFYIKRHNRLDPVKLVNESFINKTTGENTLIKLEPDSLIERLKNKELFCDLSLSYTFTLILPNVVALAGTSQQEYLTPMKNILLLTNINSNYRLFDENTSNSIKSRGNCYLMNETLLELPSNEEMFPDFLENSQYLSELESFLNRPLEETLGSLKKFQYMTQLNLEKYSPLD